jgi:hypothetical protein
MLKVRIADDYANETGFSLTTDDILLEKILSCEVAIYCMRRSVDADGFNIDIMTEVRRNFINEYEKNGKKYLYFNGDL